MLKDVIEYLEQFFTVKCIDIPGFCREKQPMSLKSIDQLVSYVQTEIERLQLDTYYLAGISFGYYLANQVCDPYKCQGIIAIYPFLSAKHLKMNTFALQLLKTSVKGINKFKLSQAVWKSSLFPSILGLTGVSKEEIALMYAHIDAATFFATASFILSCESEVQPKDIPHVVIVNEQDELLQTSHLVQTFSKYQKALLLKSPIAHFASAITKQDIKQTFPPEIINQAKQFLVAH